MKLRTRLIVAFFVVILVPILLFCVAGLGFTSYQMRMIEENYGVPISFESMADSMQVIGKSTQSVFEKLKRQAEDDPEVFLDETYLSKINEELSGRYSYLLVRKNEDIYYNGSNQDVSKLFQELPAFREFSSASDGGSYIGKDVKAFVKQLDIEFEDQSKGSLFIISSAGKIIEQTKVLLRDLVISIIVILIITASVLSIWIYTGIQVPLKKLSEATHRIKEKDFDFELDVKGSDEISQLCRDFDEMRQRLKDLDEEKEAFDRQSKELISNISHDLKTPITAVKGYVEGIMDGVADTPEKMDRYIRTIYIKANDMDRLINELTFYSKIDTNRIPYNFNKINVVEYFDDCAEEVGLEMRERKISFSYINNIDINTLVIADAEQMKRVINNIIGNSVKYMDKEKKKVELRVLDAVDFIQVEIEDNGKGIPAKEIGSIFDRFYRTDLSRNSAQGGSGIGLSIVKKIVEDHGGRIWASSKVGEGTTMHFVLRKYQEVPVNE
ncbi:MAG: HAMP domain-containing sensor histidine kinase [Candidatus Choladocola sp.]|nr:HAMP domain-containing sensor histidine kinase [Candidatus Choladocola sp.]